MKTGNSGHPDGASSQGAAATRRTKVLDCTAAVQVKTATVASTSQAPVVPTSSCSPETTQFMQMLGDTSFPSLASPEEQDTNFDDFLTGMSTDNTEFEAFANTGIDGSQLWTASSSTETVDWGVDLFGPAKPSTASMQVAELRFTELMVKIRDVGFSDMESSEFAASQGCSHKADQHFSDPGVLLDPIPPRIAAVLASTAEPPAEPVQVARAAVHPLELLAD